jgi:hypothetical protein
MRGVAEDTERRVIEALSGEGESQASVLALVPAIFP